MSWVAENIHWHDCTIERVIENLTTSELVMEVSYPIDWNANRFAPRLIVFTDPLDYRIEEGFCSGYPTILDATIEDAGEGFRRIILETNWGRRSLRFRKLELRDPQSNVGAAS